ncbi:MAG: hypothetical protein ACK5UY_03310 [Holosporales bacterium]|jgi:aconitase A
MFRAARANRVSENITVRRGIFTADEVDYYTNGGILPFVLRGMAA